MLIGIVDSKVDLAHEDLIGQIAHELNTGEIADVPHGTGVASLIVGKTNNKGV